MSICNVGFEGRRNGRIEWKMEGSEIEWNGKLVRIEWNRTEQFARMMESKKLTSIRFDSHTLAV